MATDLRVGGLIEEVAPRRVTDSGDRLRLLALVAVSLIVHGVGIARTAVPARDAITFARMALQLERPREAGFEDAVAVMKDPNTHHPPGYPLAVLATSWGVRAFWDADLPDQMLLSAQLTGAIAGVLLVFPMYWLGRMLFDKWVGFLAALVFQVLPVPVEVTTEGLSEGPFFLCVATALLFGVRTVRKPGIGGFLLCGMATGCAYLVRPEGMAAAAAVGAVIVGMAVFRRWAVAESAGRLTALVVGALLVATPYMVLIGGVTNKPAGRNLVPNFSLFDKRFGAGPHADGPALFAAWYDPAKHSSVAGWLPGAVWEETGTAFHHATLFFAVIGLAVAARRFRSEPEFWVPIVYGALMLAAAAGMAYRGQTMPSGERNHYLSERHLLAVVLVGCLFAAAGIQALPGLLARISLVGKWPGHPAVAVVLAVAVVASCVPKLLKTRHADRAGHREAGRWLRDHVSPDDALIDPYEWAQFYAGWTLRRIPPDNPNAVFTYAVNEGEVRGKDDGPHSALPRRQAALNVRNDGDRSALVFQWPEQGEPAVVVHRLDSRIPRKKP